MLGSFFQLYLVYDTNSIMIAWLLNYRFISNFGMIHMN